MCFLLFYCFVLMCFVMLWCSVFCIVLLFCVVLPCDVLGWVELSWVRFRLFGLVRLVSVGLGFVRLG